MKDRTDRQQMIDANITSEARFRALVTSLPHLVFGCRQSGDRTWPSPQWVVYTGYSEDDSLHFGWLDAIHPDDRPQTMAAWRQAPQRRIYLIEHRIWNMPEQTYRWHQTRAAPLSQSLIDGTEWVGSSDDIHDLRLVQTRLAEAEQELRILVEGVPQLLWRSCDKGNWTWASPQWLKFTGQTQQETHGRGWLNAVMLEDRPATMQAWEEARIHGTLDVEFRVRRASDGLYVWHRTRSTPVRDGDGRIVEWLGTTTDIQALKNHARDLEAEILERQRTEARLAYIAFHDDLTQLRSRLYLMDRLTAALSASKRANHIHCALLFLDLDRFKLINDSLGHQAGDQLLVEVARRLGICTRPEHTLARLGGDEFAVMLESPEPGEVIALARAVIAAMRPAVVLGEQEVFTSCSIGVIEAFERHSHPEDLLRDADTALYYAKRHDLGGFAVFTEAMRSEAVKALNLRTDLHRALSRNELFLQYQPICRASDGQIIGAEALIRWQHPDQGLIPPAAFIEVAEDTGLIRDIGRWVLGTACRDLRSWQERYPDLKLRLSVNMSSEELNDPDYVDGMQSAIRETGIDPRFLQLEMTESVFLQSSDSIRSKLDSIRTQGVRVALDDFGTGYSSLSYLASYDIDVLKIDRSFILQMVDHKRSKAIVEAIVRLGRDMEVDVVAEGVETNAQLEMVIKAGCHYVQGYLLGKPMLGSKFVALLENMQQLRTEQSQ